MVGADLKGGPYIRPLQEITHLMRAIVQRVASARVRVGELVVGEIGRGLLVLVGVGRDDTSDDVKAMAAKICEMRVFEADGKPMDRSVVDVGGGNGFVTKRLLRDGFDAAFRERKPACEVPVNVGGRAHAIDIDPALLG